MTVRQMCPSNCTIESDLHPFYAAQNTSSLYGSYRLQVIEDLLNHQGWLLQHRSNVFARPAPID